MTSTEFLGVSASSDPEGESLAPPLTVSDPNVALIQRAIAAMLSRLEAENGTLRLMPELRLVPPSNSEKKE
jgi:hypothetical protein